MLPSQSNYIKGPAAMQVQENDADKHQQTANQGVKKKFDGGIEPILPSPDANQQKHRNKHCFPEDIKKEKVKGTEHAHHGPFQEKQSNIKFLSLLLHTLPGNKDAQDGNKGGQENKKHADAVQA